MQGHSTYVPISSAAKWLEARLPIIGLFHSSFVAYPTPKNLNYFWTFGGILTVMLVSQIITASFWRCTTPHIRLRLCLH